jgi:hypothetical protein
MIDRGHRVLDALDGRHLRERRSPQHDDGETERTRRRDLAMGGAAAAVLGGDDFDAVLHEERAFVGLVERTAGGDVGGMRYVERRLDGIDAADEIMVLRRRGEWRDLLASEREEHMARKSAERRDGTYRVADLDPAITCNRGPGWATQRDQRHLREHCGTSRIGGDRGRIGMRRVNENVDARGGEMVREPLRAAESAEAHRHGLPRRCRGAAGERQRDRKIGTVGEALGKLPRLRGAAQYEDACHGAC